MAIVQSVDYVNKRIYLSASTMNVALDTLDVYREVRELRRITDSHQCYLPMVVAGGNLEKIPGVSYTPAYVQLLYGCRIIPYNSSHTLKLVRDTFTDDGVAGRDVFNRALLTPGVVVDIDVDVPELEIRQVNISGGTSLTSEEVRAAVWGAQQQDYGPTSMGNWLLNKVLTLGKYLGVQ
jgi:hypothetical protein